MNTDTAGNIIETFKHCRCGFTAGCDYCRPIYFPPSVPATGGVPNYEEDTITKEDKARIYKKTMRSSI